MKNRYIYRVGPGDVLIVKAFDDPTTTREVTVTPDGQLTYPLASTVPAKKLTLKKVAATVADDLVASERVINPATNRVTVTLLQSHSAQIQIINEIGKQTTIPFRDKLTLMQALNKVSSISWITTKTKKLHIVHNTLNDPRLIAMDYENILIANKRDIFLKPNDIVVVPAKNITRFDRYITQLLSPIRNIASTGQQTIGAATSFMP